MIKKYAFLFSCLAHVTLIALTPDYYTNTYHHYDPAFTYSEDEAILKVGTPFETLEVGGYFEIDSQLFFGEDHKKSRFIINEACCFFAGELYDQFGFLLMPRWGTFFGADLKYAWFETLKPKWGRLRVGKFKQPFSLEVLKSTLFRTFDYIGIPFRNYSLTEDVGIMIYGKTLNDALDYSIACMNGRPSGDLDLKSDIELIGRLVYQIPIYKRWGSCYIGCAATLGSVNSDISGHHFVTETNNPFWRWSDNPNEPVVNKGLRNKWEVDFEWLLGSFYLCLEYLHTDWGTLKMGKQKASFSGEGGYIECSYILTGETKPRNAQVIPKYHFNPCRGHLGAFEIAARYEFFYASHNMITLGFAEGANLLHGPLLAFNWYLNSRVAVKIDTQYLWFNHPYIDDDHKFPYEANIVARLQAVF